MAEVKLIIKGIHYSTKSIKILIYNHKQLPSTFFEPGLENSLDKAKEMLYALTGYDKNFAPIVFCKIDESNNKFVLFYETIIPLDTKIKTEKYSFIDFIEAKKLCLDL